MNAPDDYAEREPFDLPESSFDAADGYVCSWCIGPDGEARIWLVSPDPDAREHTSTTVPEHEAVGQLPASVLDRLHSTTTDPRTRERP